MSLAIRVLQYLMQIFGRGHQVKKKKLEKDFPGILWCSKTPNPHFTRH